MGRLRQQKKRDLQARLEAAHAAEAADRIPVAPLTEMKLGGKRIRPGIVVSVTRAKARSLGLAGDVVILDKSLADEVRAERAARETA